MHPDHIAEDAAYRAYFALTGSVPDFAGGTITNPADMYGPRFAGATLVGLLEGKQHSDGSLYFMPSLMVLVAPHVADQLTDAFTAAVTEFLTTEHGRATYTRWKSSRLTDLLDDIPPLLLWEHGIVVAADLPLDRLNLDDELLEPDALTVLGLKPAGD